MGVFFFFNFSNNDIVGPEEINQEGLGVSCNVPFHLWLKTWAMCSFEFVFFWSMANILFSYSQTCTDLVYLNISNMALNWCWEDEFGCGEQECQIQDLAIGKLERQAEWKDCVSQEDTEAQLLWGLVGIRESDSSLHPRIPCFWNVCNNWLALLYWFRDPVICLSLVKPQKWSKWDLTPGYSHSGN